MLLFVRPSRAPYGGFALLALVFLPVLSTLAPQALGSTLAGSLTGAPLPQSASAGRATVRAVDIETDKVVTSTPVGANGAYSLALPSGNFALETSIVSGTGSLLQNLAAVVRVRGGAARHLNLTAHRRKRAKRHSHRGRRHGHAHKGRSANTNPRDGRSYPGLAIGFEPFTGGGGEWDYVRNALPDLLTTDLVEDATHAAAAAYKPGCDWTIIDNLRYAEIERELALQQTPYIDPTTRVQPGHRISPDAYLDGEVTPIAGESAIITVNLRMANSRTVLRSTNVVSLPDGILAANQELVKHLIEFVLCPKDEPATSPASAPSSSSSSGPPPPPSPPAPPPAAIRYSGGFSGHAEAGELHMEWSGSATLTALQDGVAPPVGAPPGEYRLYEMTEGSAQMHIRGGNASCGYEGEASLPLTPGGTSGTLIVQTNVSEPAYQINLAFDPSQSVTVHNSGSEPECTGSFSLPLAGYYATSQSILTSSSLALSGNGEWPPGGYTTSTMWSLSPS